MERKTGVMDSLLAQSAPRSLARHATFLLFCGAGIAFYLNEVPRLFRLSLHHEIYTYIPVIPLISLYFFCVNRKTIFADLSWNWKTGPFLIASGIVLGFLAGRIGGLDENDYLSLAMSGELLWVLGAFLTAYGGRSFRNALFPLLMLVFVIPIPTPILNSLVELLRVGSTLAAHLLFKLTGVPVYRDGFSFSVPGITVEVAKECSGIRSAIALVITSLLGGNLFLRKGWTRVILTLSVFPVTVLKNGLRISTLTLLAAYVDPRFVKGAWLHKSGGMPFFAVGLLLIAPILWALWKAEKRKGNKQESS